MTDKLDFLAKLSLFESLTEEELADLAHITQEFTFEDGAIIAYQRDVADSLYIVRSGRLFARSVDEQGIVRDSRSYLTGSSFGEAWLFAPQTHPATIRGAGNGRLLVINGRDFIAFLNAHPDVINALEPLYDQTDNQVAGLPEAAWEEAEKIRRRADPESSAVSLLPDELVEFYARRSRWYLLIQILGPLAVLLLIPILDAALSSLAAGFWNYLTIGLNALLLLGSLGWLLFNFLDWRNDYFVITNKHLVHREFNLRRFRTNLVKIPVGQIQSVEVDRPTLIATLFNIGTARVTTAAQGKAGIVRFDNIDDPLLVKETLNRLSQRVKAIDAGNEQAMMRDSLEKHFQVAQPLQAIEDEELAATRQAAAEQQPSFWETLRRAYRWRVEEGDTVTYRKHLFVLLRTTAWPLLAAVLLLLFFLLLTRVFAFGGTFFFGIFLIVLLGNLGWLVWQIEDWRNDTFQLTSRVVIDIDRRPFGFGESRKQANLSNIQNVTADRPGLLQTIFNFGNVHVETAGALSDITFENVPNPSQIQSDIFRRLDLVRQAERVKEGALRRKEYAVLLDVYKQAMEQERIPRRTPPPGEYGLEN